MALAYYNEHDSFAAAWLRELIKAGHIALGEVDERSIEDVKPSELRSFTQCHFFAGIGVWSYALRQAGWPDDQPVWTGSCPCQPFSTAGQRKGVIDERHLWPAFFHLISECRPTKVFGEQVASKAGRNWFSGVRVDLEGVGYLVGCADLCAAGVGAPHIRQRLYWGAGRGASYPTNRSDKCGSSQRNEWNLENGPWKTYEWIETSDKRKFRIKPGLSLLAHGATHRVGRLRGYGNALVAPVAKAFIEAFLETE